MVLNRNKRITAGKAPQRLDESATATSAPIERSVASKRPPSASKAASVMSQGPKGSKKKAPRLKLRVTQASIRPATMRREEDILTASLSSPKALISENEL